MQKFKENIRVLRAEIPLWEYLLWWTVRVCMIVYIVRQLREQHNLVDYALPFLNTLGTFAVFLVRMIFPRKTVLGKLSFRAQKYITVMIFAGSFLGNYLRIYDINNPLHYDWILHAVSGVTITMLGYHLFDAMTDHQPAQPQTAACASMGFSFFLMVAWELMEFCGDFLFGDCNQKYNWQEMLPTDPFYPLFSKGVPGMQQLPVLDTMMDLALAFFSTIATGVVLYLVLKRRTRRTKASNV